MTAESPRWIRGVPSGAQERTGLPRGFPRSSVKPCPELPASYNLLSPAMTGRPSSVVLHSAAAKASLEATARWLEDQPGWGFEPPGGKGGDKGALVDQAVLKREQSEEEMAVGGGSPGVAPIVVGRSVQAPASGAGPGIESRRSGYRKSVLFLHPCRRASSDGRDRPGVGLPCDSAAGGGDQSLGLGPARLWPPAPPAAS